MIYRNKSTSRRAALALLALVMGSGLAALAPGASAQVRSQTLDQDTFALRLSAPGPVPDSPGLRSSMWQGGDEASVIAALEAASYGMTSPAAARLQWAVLSVGAQPPRGMVASPQLQLARTRALYESGHISAAAEVLALGGVGPDAGDAAQLDVAIRFLSGDANGACRAANMVDAQGAAPFWTRTRAACFALAGEGAAAELTLDVARRQLRGMPRADGVDTRLDAPFSYWLADAAGAPTFGEPVPPRDAIEYALARAAGASILDEDVVLIPAPLQTALAADGDVSPGVRVPAAMVSAARASVDLRTLGQAFSASAQDSTLSGEGHVELEPGFTTEGPVNPAIFIQAAVSGAHPDLTIDALAAALQSSGTSGEFKVIAAYLGAVLRDAPPSFMSGGHAPLFAYAALATGDVVTARNWANAAFGSDGTEPFDYALLSVMLLVLDPEAGAAQKADAVRTLSRASQIEDHYRLAEQAALIVLAVGADDASDIRAMAGAGAQAAPALTPQGEAHLAAMRAAADAGVPGEAALYAAALLDHEGASNPLAAAHAAQTLWWFGLDAHARAVAIEALLALSPRFAVADEWGEDIQEDPTTPG